jgi:hypothetical protein
MNNINVFVYCGGKCGSSTLYNTFGKNGFSPIKIHDNNNYQAVFKQKDSIFDLINYSSKNKIVYIIDSYRTPIERKISSFFENISIHLPNYNNLSIDEIVMFFNNNFINHLEEYHSINEVLKHYNIPLWKCFDFKNKYNIIKKDNIIFIKILFKDIQNWNKILSEIFNKKIIIYENNLTSNKSINDLYIKFKKKYKVPVSYIENILKNDKEFKIFNTPDEQIEYINNWLKKSY